VSGEEWLWVSRSSGAGCHAHTCVGMLVRWASEPIESRAFLTFRRARRPIVHIGSQPRSEPAFCSWSEQRLYVARNPESLSYAAKAYESVRQKRQTIGHRFGVKNRRFLPSLCGFSRLRGWPFPVLPKSIVPVWCCLFMVTPMAPVAASPPNRKWCCQRGLTKSEGEYATMVLNETKRAYPKRKESGK